MGFSNSKMKEGLGQISLFNYQTDYFIMRHIAQAVLSIALKPYSLAKSAVVIPLTIYVYCCTGFAYPNAIPFLHYEFRQ